MITASHRYYWLGFTGLLLLFVLFKLQDVSLPYFWDELGVYAPGALKMADTGLPNLLPSSLDPEYSRGHPLLCFATFAAGFRLFGNSVIVGHVVALLIACITLLLFFLFVRKAFDPLTALLSGLLLAIQPLFLAMAGIILPEMLLTLFTVLAIWGLSFQKNWLYLMGACLAVLTKESGIVLPGVALLYQFLSGIKHKDLFTAKRLKSFSILAIPVLVYAAFLVIQKVQNGWFFFPLHTGLIRKDPFNIWQRFLNVNEFILRYQGRWPLGFMAGAMVVINIFSPAKNQAVRRGINLSALFILLFALFSGTNYYLHRYTLPALPFMILLAVTLLTTIVENFPVWLKGLLVTGLIGGASFFAVKHHDPQKFSDCNDMSYRHVVHAQQQAIKWAEQQPWSYELITTNFPVSQALEDRRLGYISKQKFWPHTEDWKLATKHGIIYWQDGRLPIPQNKKFKELKRFQDADAVFSVIVF